MRRVITVAAVAQLVLSNFFERVGLLVASISKAQGTVHVSHNVLGVYWRKWSKLLANMIYMALWVKGRLASKLLQQRIVLWNKRLSLLI